MTIKDWETEHLYIMDTNNEGDTFESFVTDPNRFKQLGHIMSQVKQFGCTVCSLCIDYEHDALQEQVYHWYKIILKNEPFGPKPKLIPQSLYNKQARIYQRMLEQPEQWMERFISSHPHKKSSCPRCAKIDIQNPYK